MEGNNKINKDIDEASLFDDNDLPIDVKKHVDNAYKLADIILELVKRRAYLGLTQGDLAKRACTSKKTIARIESLEEIPRLDTFIKISNVLNMELSLISKE